MMVVSFIRKHSFLLAPVTNFFLSIFSLLHLCYKSELLPTCQECFTMPKTGIRVDACSRRPIEKFTAQHEVEVSFSKSSSRTAEHCRTFMYILTHSVGFAVRLNNSQLHLD